MGFTSGLEIIHGLMDRIFMLMEITPAAGYAGAEMTAAMDQKRTKEAKRNGTYSIDRLGEDEAASASYLKGRGLKILYHDAEGKTTEVGTFGVIHPEVLG